jgi:Na+/H+-translocating membrane pyrophosphatase
MGEKIKRLKYNFDKITSQNATNWKLVFFWIIVFEVLASIIEYLFVDTTSISTHIPHTIFTELIVAILITLFVWFCVYNLIFGTKVGGIKLFFFSIVGLYFVVTNDFTLKFLLQNLNPYHFFDLKFGLVFFIEFFFKLLIIYLIYQLLVCIKNR